VLRRPTPDRRFGARRSRHLERWGGELKALADAPVARTGGGEPRRSVLKARVGWRKDLGGASPRHRSKLPCEDAVTDRPMKSTCHRQSGSSRDRPSRASRDRPSGSTWVAAGKRTARGQIGQADPPEIGLRSQSWTRGTEGENGPGAGGLDDEMSAHAGAGFVSFQSAE
jgi:hypothetical protein